MTTYFAAPDGIDEPTLWAETDDPRRPVAILRHRDLGPMTHHWDELVARVIAGNPDRMIDRDALTQGIEQINNTDLAAAIADRTENAAAALRVNELANKIDDLTRTPSRPSQGLMQVMPAGNPDAQEMSWRQALRNPQDHDIEWGTPVDRREITPDVIARVVELVDRLHADD